MLNICRPAVLRQYFSLNFSNPKEGNNTVARCTYGLGSGTSSVGMDPASFVTREINTGMKVMSDVLYEFLLQNRSHFNLDDANLSSGFNHCTVIIYYAGQSLKEAAKLGMYCDTVYSCQEGVFQKMANSQVKDTPTVTYSLGDGRILKTTFQGFGNTKIGIGTLSTEGIYLLEIRRPAARLD